jgi:CheY-like chemotaxis protein
MNQLSTLLLVDPDPRGLETLTYGFEREGCSVAGTSDPALASDLLRTTTPQLAVVSLRSPERSGLDVITGIKRGAPVRRVPIVAVGDASLKQAALAAGTNDFVSTPLFVRDVVNVSRLLTLSHPVPNAPHPEVEVQARLSEYHGLFYLLRALAVTGRSGIVLLSRGNKRAELRICDGAVMAVHIAGLQGLPALHQLLLWEEAALSLKFRSVPQRSNLHLSAQEMLDECERFLRDFAHAARDLGAPSCVYIPAPDRDPGTSGLQPSQLGPALRLFDGRRGLTDVIEESPFRVFDTLRVVKRLLESGTLVVKSAGNADGSGPRSILEQWAVTPDPRGIVGDRRRQSRRLKTVDGVAPAPASPPLTGMPTANFVPELAARTPASAPIPLTNKKSSTAGEIPARKSAGTPAAVAALAEAPTVQVRIDNLPPPASLAPAWPAPVTARHAQLTPEPPVRRATPAPMQAAAVPVRRPTPAPAAALAPEPEPPVRRATPAPRENLRRTPPPDSMRRTPPPDSLRRTPAPGKHDTGKRATLEAAADAKLRKVLPATRLTPSTAFDDLEADFFAREADLYKKEAVDSFDDLDRDGVYRPKKR